jgi:hypothetical protein
MIVISDLLDMFVRDPQIEIKEARNMINEIVNSITTKTRAFKEDVLVIVAIPSEHNTSHHNAKSSILSNKMILPRFNKCIEIINNEDNKNKMIGIKIRNNSKSNVRRIKNTANDFHNGKLLSINKRELLIISAPE